MLRRSDLRSTAEKYQRMSNVTVDEFIESYSPSDYFYLGVRADGNQHDVNALFRKEVTRRVITKNAECAGLLLRDLYLAECEFSDMIGGSTEFVANLGQLLLEKTQCQFLDEYLAGRARSFDLECAVQPSDASVKTLRRIVEELTIAEGVVDKPTPALKSKQAFFMAALEAAKHTIEPELCE